MDLPFIGKKNTEDAGGVPISATALREEASLYQRGLASMKDLIAPPAIKVMSSHMQIGSVMSRTHFIIAYPRYLSTNWFSPIVNLDFPMDISLFVHPIDTSEILKQLRTSATRVESQIGIEQSIVEIAALRYSYGVKPVTAEVLAAQQKIADKFFELKLVPKQVRVADAAWNGGKKN